MSIKIMTAVWALKMPTGEKIVLLALADNANDEGHCWPSMQTIADKAGMTVRGAQLIVQRLEEAGHLHREQIVGKGCNYFLHPRTTFAPEDASPPNDVRPERRSQTPERRSPKPSITIKANKTDAGASGFDAFWKAYPRRVAKAAAEKAWPKACQRAEPAQIIAAARRYAADPPDDPQFIPHPATWLNQARFEDEPDDNANHGNRGRMGGGDKPARRNPAMDMLRDAIGGGLGGFAGSPEADEGAPGSYRGIGLALPAR